MSEIEGRPEIRHGQWEPDDRPPRVMPPLGLIPREIYEEKTREERKCSIDAAIRRYLDAGRPIPPEWVEEWNNLAKESGK